VRCEIKSPIAGSVLSHVASAGQRVEVGATVLLVECMKTEITIEAPQAGNVTWILPCGESIEVDTVLATIDVT